RPGCRRQAPRSSSPAGPGRPPGGDRRAADRGPVGRRCRRHGPEHPAVEGDLRIAATARIHLARALRGASDQATARTLLEANDRWYRASGGGDGALLTRCLHAAVAAEEGAGAAAGDLEAVLADARRP